MQTRVSSVISCFRQQKISISVFTLIFTCARNASMETAGRMAGKPPGTSARNFMFRCGFCLTTCGIFLFSSFFFNELCKHAHWPTLRYRLNKKKEKKNSCKVRTPLIHCGVGCYKKKVHHMASHIGRQINGGHSDHVLVKGGWGGLAAGG